MKELIRLLLAPTPVRIRANEQAERDRRAEVALKLGQASSNRAEYLELYKIMVASSEALVARRQTVNTYFLTVNGLLATATGLLIQKDASTYLSALSLCVLAIVGVIVAVVWRLVLISFGQLNRGKFAVINGMEAHLSAAIYDAEWIALGRGEDPSLYRSFTDREALVPAALLVVWTIAAVILFIVVVVSS